MSKVFVVLEQLEEETWVVGAHLSATKAKEYIKQNEQYSNGFLYYQEANLTDVDENTFLSLQRALGRVENRLGKARKALKEAKRKLAAVEIDKADGTIVMKDPVFRAVGTYDD